MSRKKYMRLKELRKQKRIIFFIGFFTRFSRYAQNDSVKKQIVLGAEQSRLFPTQNCHTERRRQPKSSVSIKTQTSLP